MRTRPGSGAGVVLVEEGTLRTRNRHGACSRRCVVGGFKWYWFVDTSLVDQGIMNQGKTIMLVTHVGGTDGSLSEFHPSSKLQRRFPASEAGMVYENAATIAWLFAGHPPHDDIYSLLSGALTPLEHRPTQILGTVVAACPSG